MIAKVKKIILIIALVLIMSMIANANSNWYQEANSDYNAQGANAFIAFGSNYALKTSNVTTYNQCSFSGSLYTPVADDMDLDGINEVVISESNQIKILSMQCEEEYSITLNTEVRAMPVLTNYNHNAYKEIAVLQNTTLSFYEFDGNNFQKIKDVTYTGPGLTGSAGEGLTCFALSNTYCLIFNTGTTNVTAWRSDNDNIERRDSQLTQNFQTPIRSSGVSNSRIGSETFRAIVGQGFTSGTLSFTILNETGYRVGSYIGVNMGTSITSILQQDVFYAKVGGVFRIFESSKMTTTAEHYYWSIKTISGGHVQHIYSNPNCDTCGMTNFMVADYNKNGQNDACIMMKNSTHTITESYLRCFDSLGIATVDVEIQNTFNMSDDNLNGAVMGDFLSGHSTLGFGTAYGIYYINSSGNLNREYNTGVTLSTSRNGKLITVFGNTVGDPAIIYTDSSYGFILSNEGSAVCGDGICSGLENDLVCSADCSINATTSLNTTGMPCVSASDCESNKCNYGQCVLGVGGDGCTLNGQCISGVCHVGICTKSSLWANIEQSKDEQFGTDSNTNNFISIFIGVLSIIGIISIAHGAIWSIIVASVVFVVEMAFFTIVGWLSAWIVFVMFIIFAICGFIVYLVAGSS